MFRDGCRFVRLWWKPCFAFIPATMVCVLLQADRVHACGGFFCTLFPMNQVSERILFVADGETVTTHVQIQYTGSAADFAWILPVPAVPELGVSHNEVFQQLQFATQPTFILDWKEDPACGFIWPPFARAEVVTLADAGVEVVAEGRVGPYDTVVITSDDPGAITAWLQDNGYNLGALGADLLRPYVEGGFLFLALKLAPDRDLGDLQPIALTYAAERPGIPIRLTAVATQPNLGVLVWVLGANRAIPTNYLHVEINEARIDWLNGGLNYDQVVTEAANEAGGQAFATDYAGSSDLLKDRFYPEGRYDLAGLQLLKDPVDFLNALLVQGFPRDAQIQSLIRRHIPMPPGVLEEGVLQVLFRGDRDAYQRAIDDGSLQGLAERSFYNNMEAYRAYITDLTFDPVALAEDLRKIVVEPLQKAQALVEAHPYLTRLYTTLSAEEMTVDPMFDFNPDLPEVANVRRATARCECPDGKDTKPEDKLVVITLSDGREIRVKPEFRPIPLPGPEPIPLPGPVLADGSPPPLAAARIEQMATSGPPEFIRGLTTVSPDFNDDGAVNFQDFLAFAAAFGKNDPRFDLSGNGTVDFEDFLTFVESVTAPSN